MPVLPNENLNTRAEDLFQSLDILYFRRVDTLALHRLPAKDDKIRIVLIRLSSPTIKDTLEIDGQNFFLWY